MIKLGLYARPASIGPIWKLTDYKEIVAIGPVFVVLAGDSGLYYPHGLVVLDDDQTKQVIETLDITKADNVNKFEKAVFASVTFENLAELGYTQTNLYDVYMSEYGNYNGTSPAKVEQWCRGLPSAISFPFCNWDILNHLEKQGFERKTENGRFALIEKYWHILGLIVHRQIMADKAKLSTQ